ncbi:hypothetical protein [Pontibacter sp. G13]|uniref:hypothetical protein n=1 Tax=Pontibacter sp. G13 TaxID=3074898 RepID=UPI00288B923F|nr:hypothetical protein [Pontibacter sp. G13]WNJ19699.1 hypothetical protein RJD25_04385 [Pontibacter sp. G13]
MEWYGPITILPAVGMIILSTTHFLVALNNEIVELEREPMQDREVIASKLSQLKRLGWANSSLYASALFFLIAGLWKAATMQEDMFFAWMLVGVCAMTLALGFLFVHSLKSISIRQKRLMLSEEAKTRNENSNRAQD